MPRLRDWRELLRWETLLAVILLLVIAVNIQMSPHFLGTRNLVNLFQLSIEKIIVALIMTFIIINGEIDLSVASVMGLSACLFAWLYEQGTPAEVAIPPRRWQPGCCAARSWVSGSRMQTCRRWR